jgi:hypothetical protein
MASLLSADLESVAAGEGGERLAQAVHLQAQVLQTGHVGAGESSIDLASEHELVTDDRKHVGLEGLPVGGWDRDGFDLLQLLGAARDRLLVGGGCLPSFAV